ncbi:Alpha/Beta hydrolase protein [Phascolomyces articulosus]|uniref:Alpha/Beta hydrolase protein n=1 Tax=Phascolomyces articulosus TaxID=60185 RepID=A0AAD5PCS4_9FUNG|nr:Alpha/Beta hydrolase protein [Phascolomyces articulosus]
MSIEPFEVPSISPERLALLKEKLKNAEYPNELEKDVGWTYGAPRWAVEPLVKAWLNDYNWETARAEMNRWHHYHVTIQGLRVHFIHEPSKSPDAIPLLLLNGWPSNFYEYHKVIEPLRDGANGGQAFHVVIPSLPGYGFSEAPKLTGHNVSKNGEIIHELMTAIGYNEYVTHGSDWGSMIGKWIAQERSAHCKAYHTVMPLCLPPLPTPTHLFSHPLKVLKFLASISLGFDTVYGKGHVRLKGRSFADVENDREAGYRGIQGTRPYTLAFGLTDSPVGLLAWMLEKFHNWTFHPSGSRDTVALPETISVDEFLTQVTIYWLTNTMSSSTRLYYEAFHDEKGMKDMMWNPVKIPTGVAYYPGEITKLAKEWLEASMNTVHYAEVSVGGHFPSLEVDELFVDDIQRFGKLIKTKKYIQ